MLFLSIDYLYTRIEAFGCKENEFKRPIYLYILMESRRLYELVANSRYYPDVEIARKERDQYLNLLPPLKDCMYVYNGDSYIIPCEEPGYQLPKGWIRPEDLEDDR
jgi:hypothetical protein